MQLLARDTRDGGKQTEEVRQRVHPGRLDVHEMFLLAAQKILAVYQPQRLHHVRDVRQQLLHIGPTGVRPVAEERPARGRCGQGIPI